MRRFELNSRKPSAFDVAVNRAVGIIHTDHVVAAQPTLSRIAHNILFTSWYVSEATRTRSNQLLSRGGHSMMSGQGVRWEIRLFRGKTTQLCTFIGLVF